MKIREIISETGVKKEEPTLIQDGSGKWVWKKSSGEKYEGFANQQDAMNWAATPAGQRALEIPTQTQGVEFSNKNTTSTSATEPVNKNRRSFNAWGLYGAAVGGSMAYLNNKLFSPGVSKSPSSQIGSYTASMSPQEKQRFYRNAKAYIEELQGYCGCIMNAIPERDDKRRKYAVWLSQYTMEMLNVMMSVSNLKQLDFFGEKLEEFISVADNHVKKLDSMDMAMVSDASGPCRFKPRIQK